MATATKKRPRPVVAWPGIKPREAERTTLLILDDGRELNIPCVLYDTIRDRAFSHGIEWANNSSNLREKAKASISAAKCLIPCEGFKHLRGIIETKQGRRGYFVVGNHGLILDRAAYKEMAAEAQQQNLKRPWNVYCRICTYSGPGLEVIQLGAEV